MHLGARSSRPPPGSAVVLACPWERGRPRLPLGARSSSPAPGSAVVLARLWERGRPARPIADVDVRAPKDVDVRAPMRSLPSRKSKIRRKKSNVRFFCPKLWDKSVELPHNRPKAWDKSAELPRQANYLLLTPYYLPHQVQVVQGTGASSARSRCNVTR